MQVRTEVDKSIRTLDEKSSRYLQLFFQLRERKSYNDLFDLILKCEAFTLIVSCFIYSFFFLFSRMILRRAPSGKAGIAFVLENCKKTNASGNIERFFS